MPIGFFVAGIDYFEGDPIHLSREKPNWNLNEWIEGKRKRADEILPVWVEAIKDKYGSSCYPFPVEVEFRGEVYRKGQHKIHGRR